MTKRDYRSEALTVHWDSDLCIHSGHCVQAIRAVFDPKRRPWIMVENSDDDSIARAVEGCPSHALTYTRHDEPGAPPPPPPTTTVVVNENGPLEIYGEIEVLDADGQAVRRGQHLFLCRCGNSKNKPYCDGSHRLVQFADPGKPVGDRLPPQRLPARQPRALVEHQTEPLAPGPAGPGPDPSA